MMVLVDGVALLTARDPHPPRGEGPRIRLPPVDGLASSRSIMVGPLTALLALLATVRSDVDSNRLDAEEPRDASSSSSSMSAGDAWPPLLDAMRLYAECGGLGVDGAGPCLKVRLVAEMDRASRGLAGDVGVVDGVTFVRDEAAPAGWPAPLSGERELEAVLPRALDDREEVLDNMILDRVVGFFRSHSLQLRMAALEDVQGSFAGEGRKKGGGGGGGGGKKGGLVLLLLPMLAFGSLLPLAFGALFLLAGKALLVSKIALLLAAILGIKKLFSQDGHGHESTVVVSGHEHHGRALDGAPAGAADPHRLAYRGHLREEKARASSGGL